MLTEINESLTYDGLPLLLLLAFGTLLFTVRTETNLSYAQLLQPDTKDALITRYTCQISHYQITHARRMTTLLAKG